MSLEEYRLADAWRMVEESMRTGKPLKENKSKRKTRVTESSHQDNEYYDEDDQMEEDAGFGGATVSGNAAGEANCDGTAGIARFNQKIGKKVGEKVKKRNEGMDMGVGAASPGIGGAMQATDMNPVDGMGMGMGTDSVGAVSDIIERLKERFPSADIKVAVQLPSGATFADAEIEAALDAVDGSDQEMISHDGENDDSNEEDDDANEPAGSDAVEFSNTPDEGDEEEDYNDDDDDTDDEESEDDDDDETEEIEEGDVLDGARKPRQGPDQYLHNKGINESEDREGDDGEGIEPCCFTMTIDQWESFLNSDPFKRM